MWRLAFSVLIAVSVVGFAEADLADLLKLRASTKSPLLAFKDSHVKKYLFRSQRSYGLYILFEPAEDGACPYCVELRKQTHIVANAYNRSTDRDPSDMRIFFVSVSPKAAPQIYQQFSVQALPLLAYLAPGAADQLSLQPFPLTIEGLTEPFSLANWVQETSQVSIHIPLPLLRRPGVQYGIFGVILLLILWKLPVLLRNYKHPMVGFVLSLIVYSVVMNGTVWNAIHDSPYWGGGGNFFMGGMHSQYKLEGVIMTVIFLTLMTLWVLLTNWAPYSNRYIRRPLVLLLLVALAFLMNSVFRIVAHMKMGGGYPFYFDIPSLFG